MSFIEITGQPCAGKSSFIIKKIFDKEVKFLKKGIFRKIFYFFLGLYFLGYKRAKLLYFWSFMEDAPIYFKINIFLNASFKFGIFYYLQSLRKDKKTRFLVDEGISHLPFLFLKTDTKKIINFIASELQSTEVNYLSSPGYEMIYKRLLARGHKRLKFLLLSSFVSRNLEIENILLAEYPDLCKNFKILNNAERI